MNTGAAAPVTLGIVGTGRIALAEHLPALRRQPRLRVVALCDTSPDNLARAAALFPEAARYDDDRALLQHPGLQAVGVLTPPRDAESLTAALGGLLRDEARRRRLRAAGLEAVDELSWSRVADRVVAAYEDAISHPGSRAWNKPQPGGGRGMRVTRRSW